MVKAVLSLMKNKIRRTKMMLKLKYKIKQEAAKNRKKRKEKIEPQTIDSMRTLEEVIEEAPRENGQVQDEFTPYFLGEKVPKMVVTTCRNPTDSHEDFARELSGILPNAEFVKRRNYLVKEMEDFCINRDYTCLIILNERLKKPEGLWLIYLPDGPTLHFKVTNTWKRKEIPNHGNPTDYVPELILKGFNTRLGERVQRAFKCLFPNNPEYRGRNVVTFKNQRDFIFLRHHRYLFNDKGERVKLQEVGPRMTLKLRNLQNGRFSLGEDQFVYHPRMQVSRKKFYI